MKVNNYLIKNGVKVLLFYLFTFLPLHAQDSLLLRNLLFVKQHDAWLTSSNAAGLSHFQRPSISTAELSLQYATGSLTPFGGASNVVQATAAVESFYRISPRTVLHGSIGYDNWTGRSMTGSVFMGEHLPFDIVEQTADNTGRKHRDTYRLQGAVGVDLWRGYSVGARINYQAANYAKYKDLRHSNKLMQLQLSVGATAPLTPWLTVGANYLYHRQTESVTYQTYGKTDRVYLSLIDYAAFMGFSEQYGTAGFTDNSREMPLVEDRNGGSVQLDVRPLRDLSFHNELTYTHGKGYYGRKSPYTIVYTNHQRDVFSYQGRVVLQRPHTHHLLDLSAAVEKLDNNRENYRERQNEAGSTYYEYYSDVQTAKKRWYHFSALYTLHLGIRGEQPLWTLSAAYHWQQRQQTDFFHSLPLSRTRLFLAVNLNSLLIVAIPSLVMGLLGGLIMQFHTGYADCVPVTLLNCLLLILFFCMFSMTAVLAVMLTGNIVVCVLAMGVFLSWGPMLLGILDWMRSSFFRTAWGPTPVMDILLQYSSPSCFTLGITEPSVLRRALSAFAIAVLLFLLNRKLYSIRPSEAAEKAMAFPKTEAPVKCIITFTMGLAGAMFFHEIQDSTGWSFFGLFCGAALTHCIIGDHLPLRFPQALRQEAAAPSVSAPRCRRVFSIPVRSVRI